MHEHYVALYQNSPTNSEENIGEIRFKTQVSKSILKNALRLMK
jgi:hypothetical protein